MKQLFFHNLSLKLLSIFLAFVLWLFVLSQKTIEYGVAVPVKYVDLPENFITTSNLVDTVNLRVAGPRPLINTLKPDRMAVTLDLSNVKVGANAFQLMEDRFDVPRGLKVTQISPAEVSVTVDVLERRMVRVKANLKGEVPSGFMQDEKAIRVEPPVVEVTGARHEVSDVATVWTQPIDVSSLRNDLSLKVPIDRSDPRTRGVNPPEVLVTIRVHEKPGEKAPAPATPAG